MEPSPHPLPAYALTLHSRLYQLHRGAVVGRAPPDKRIGGHSPPYVR